MTDLDAVIERARSANVDRAAAERYVRELDRWARPEEPRRRWVPWFAAGLAAAAVVVLVIRWPSGTAPDAAISPVRIGDHVAVVAAPETVYRVVRADAGGTEIAIDRGTVTARLWHTEQPHRLALSGGGVTAIATGTRYSLAVGPAGPVVSVIEGTVEVRAADGVHAVHAGTRWPPADGASETAASRALLALTAPPPVPVENARVTSDDAPAIPPDAADAALDVPSPEVHVVPPDAPTIKDRWRTARLLRAQGQFTAALAECLAIVDARDPTWSPIALVEAIRIELGPLADPERAIALADRMIREWPGDALASEARELRCRALRQLGRAAECTPTTTP